MQPETAMLLQDMLEAANAVASFTAGKTPDEFLNDLKLRSAVQWQFAVIGEALSQLAKQDPITAQQISEHQRIIGFRNQLIHGYRVIRNTVTWSIIQDKLPVLRRELEAMLRP